MPGHKMIKNTVFVLLCIVGVGFAVPAKLGSVKVADDDVVVDCYPEPGSNQQTCENRGCIWQSSDIAGYPWCTFQPGWGYLLDGDSVDTDLGFTQNLVRPEGQPSLYGGDITNVRLSVEYWSETILRVKIDDPNSNRYEVPVPINNQPTAKATNTDYDVTITNEPQFGITVTRKSTGTVIFNTNFPGFNFADQFLQTTTSLPSSNFYGLGEQRHGRYPHDLNFRLWTAWSHQNDPVNDYNLYGVHPFYVSIENDGNANGVFLLNSNAQEFALQPAPAITWRTIGGILDFYIYLGPTPDDVVKQHLSLIGQPQLPSYWFLGYQLSRYGYKSTDEIRGVMNSMIDNEIPYDVQVTDIDAFDNWRDFTVNPNGFSDLADLVAEMHSDGLRYMPIVDPCIPSGIDDYPPLDDGVSMNIFTKADDGTIIQEQMWPGPCYVPDFSHANATAYWTKQLQSYYTDQKIEYDAIWIDMNEPSVFVAGSATGCANNSINYPPYLTHILGTEGGIIFDQTLCPDVVQTFGQHYDVHSLYGYSQGKVTYQSLESVFPGKRPNILSRSQFSGSGTSVNHWLGDNFSNWDCLRDSIPGILEYNLFGIPLVGADICGFNDDTNLELCIRWTQLGVFYPYCRNHNSGTVAQDPPSLGPEMIDVAKRMIGERYRLLPYLYTLLHDVHSGKIGTVARGPAHEFPQDPNTWGIDNHFLWGSALYISPVVEEGATSVEVYLPQARWFNYYTGTEVETVGTTFNVTALLDDPTTVHIRGGYIVPQQEPGVTTDISRGNNFALLAALDENGNAQGSQYWDDGVSLISQYSVLTFNLAKGADSSILSIDVSDGAATDFGAPLSTVTLYGVDAPPTTVTADDVAVDSESISYDNVNKVLTVTNLSFNLPASHTLTFA